MTVTGLYNKKERAFFAACTYIGALFVSTIILWWSVLVGGNPLMWQSSQIVDSTGEAVAVLKTGQTYGFMQQICSERDIGIEIFPSLRDKRNVIYPLQNGMLSLREGCRQKVSGFVLPQLPPGEYSFQIMLRYQTALVGRDETTLSPGIKIRVE